VCQARQPAWQHPPAGREAGRQPLPAHAAHLAGASAAAARRRYQLPPTFCLPPGIDDCLVHFLCFYCASHQVGHVSLMQMLLGRWRWQLGPARRQALALLNCCATVLPGTAWYCLVPQEMRELAVRGVDGPGMHILDVLPDSFQNAEGE
jgi:hypothetical protein